MYVLPGSRQMGSREIGALAEEIPLVCPGRQVNLTGVQRLRLGTCCPSA